MNTINSDLNKLSKNRLIEIARSLGIKGFSNKKKQDIINELLKPEYKESVQKTLKLSFWEKYNNHIYGLVSILGVVLTILFFVLPSSNYIDTKENEQFIKSIKEFEELLEITKDEEIKEEIKRRLHEKRNEYERYQEFVIQLAETFNRIEINTERLKEAKKYFDIGDYRKADEILNAEIISSELEKIVYKQKYTEEEVKRLKTVRKQLAEEFIIKAQIQGTLYENPDWFSKARYYFEEAVKADNSAEIIFEYAYFLQTNNYFEDAEELYSNSLNEFRIKAEKNNDYYELSKTLNNLATLQFHMNKLENAAINFKEVLDIHTNQLTYDSLQHLPHIALTLNNLASLEKKRNSKFDALNLFQNSLDIFIKLANNDPYYYVYMGMVYNNLGLIQSELYNYTDAIDNYRKALNIFKELEADLTNLSYLSTIFNNLGLLNSEISNYEEAIFYYEEALEIRFSLVEINPEVYWIQIAETLNNVSLLLMELGLYTEALENLENSLNIYTIFSEEYPEVYSHDLSWTYNILGQVYTKIGEKEKALSYYETSLEIEKILEKQNPEAYSPYVGELLNKIAFLYYTEFKDSKRAINKAIEAYKIFHPIKDITPFNQRGYEFSIKILEYNHYNLNQLPI